MNDELKKSISIAADRITGSNRLVVSTGAGISAESGIPTYRDMNGLWKKFKPEELATREGFLSNPGLVWRWYRERIIRARGKSPNPAHYALVEMEKLSRSFLLVTQNIDNLHRRAGTKELVELHGNMERFRCMEHSHPHKFDPSWGDDPPVCHCGSLIRPDVVWFGEPLPEAELECAFRETEKCDTFLVIGTSGTVQPAAMLPSIAKSHGAFVIEVNIKESAVTPIADIFLKGEAGTILPSVVEQIRKNQPQDSPDDDDS